MSLRIKLTSIIIIMILAVIGIFSVITLTRAGSLQTAVSYEYAEQLTNANSIEIARRIEVFTGIGRILSQLFSNYEDVDENIRRESYIEYLRGTIQQNQFITGIWTAWLPNTIDSRDEELGQFQSFFTRRLTGNVLFLKEGYDGWLDYLADMKDKPVIASPIWREIFGQGNVPLMSIMYPIKNSSGRLVGLVGVNYVSDIQDIIDKIMEQLYGGKGVAAVYANDGTITAHYDKNRLNDNIKTNSEEKTLLGDMHDRIVQSIKNGGENGKPISFSRYSPVFHADYFLIYHPIFIDGIDTPWNLSVGIPESEIMRPVNEMIKFAVIFAAVILMIVSVITLFTAHKIVKPIIYVTRTLKDISEGEGDLTKRIENNSKDEVGELSRYFNNTLDKIKNLVISIKTESEKLSDIGQKLASNMNQTAAAVNQITANIQSIKTRVINQSASVTQTNASMEQVTENINKLNDHVKSQSSHISLASAAIEEMAANVHSVTETLIKNETNVNQLRDASEIGRRGLQAVAEAIKEISKDSEGLLEINSVMDNIAEQTNLLSMNAAIEAAHAGEAGRGFAVVSDEIRKLAENSGEQSKIIGQILKKIKESIDNINRSTEIVLTNFGEIDLGVKTVTEQEVTIRNAMEEQETGSKQVLDGVSQINEITRHVKNGSHEMLDGAKEVIVESSNLEKITQEITAGMNEMASGTEQINLAVNHVNEISRLNREGIEALIKEVSRFKVV